MGMPSRATEGGGEGLSLQTLVLAAASSAAAAIIVSHVWKNGTVLAAAMTPVIVAVVKELLAKPMESELVRKPVQQVSRVASSSRRRVGGSVSVRTGGAAPPSADPPLSDDPRPDAGAPPYAEPPTRRDPRSRPSDPGAGSTDPQAHPTDALGNGSTRDFPPAAGDAGLTPIRTYGRPPRR